MLETWVAAGALSTLKYGRYSTMSKIWELDPGTPGYEAFSGQYKRTGGHFVTVDGTSDSWASSPSLQMVSYRDPAQDEGKSDPNRLTMQSTYKSRQRAIHDVNIIPFFDEAWPLTPKIKAVVPFGTLPQDPEDTLTLFEGFTVTIPQLGLTNVNTTGVDDGILFDIPMSASGGGSEGAPFKLDVIDFASPNMGAILDAVFDQNNFSVSFVVADEPSLYHLDPRTGRISVEAQGPRDSRSLCPRLGAVDGPAVHVTEPPPQPGLILSAWLDFGFYEPDEPYGLCGTMREPDPPVAISALHLAARGGFREVVAILLAADADPSLEDGEGRTAQEVALEVGNLEIARLLAQARQENELRKATVPFPAY